MAVDFEQEIKTVTWKTVVIEPGVYYARSTDSEGDWAYYKFLVRKEDYDMIKVKDSGHEKMIICKFNEYAPTWTMQDIFSGKKDTEFIQADDFDSVYKGLLAFLSA